MSIQIYKEIYNLHEASKDENQNLTGYDSKYNIFHFQITFIKHLVRASKSLNKQCVGA